MEFDHLKSLGTSLGTAAITMFDESVDMVAAIRRLAHFYKHESCGQCTPCREGTSWLEDVLIRMEKGNADKREIPMLEEISRQIEGQTICALGDAAAWPVQGLLRHFKPQMIRRIEEYQQKHGILQERLLQRPTYRLYEVQDHEPARIKFPPNVADSHTQYLDRDRPIRKQVEAS